MKYHFEYDAKGRRLFVAELDNELDNIDASDEEIVDCTGECFQDMTVIFDVDRYINLYQALRGLMKIEREFGIVQMTATIRSVSGSLEFALIGCCVEVYSFGNLDITAKWFWQNTRLILVWFWIFRLIFILTRRHGSSVKWKKWGYSLMSNFKLC